MEIGTYVSDGICTVPANNANEQQVTGRRQRDCDGSSTSPALAYLAQNPRTESRGEQTAASRPNEELWWLESRESTVAQRASK